MRRYRTLRHPHFALLVLVPWGRLELPILTAYASETYVYTNSTTTASRHYTRIPASIQWIVLSTLAAFFPQWYAVQMNYHVTGGKQLSGTITTNTSKNSAVALLCASLLNRGTTTLRRMPRIEEINRLVEVLRSIGVLVEWNDDTLIITPPRELSLNTIDAVAATKTRSIILLAGALAHWETDFVLPMPGGCNLGNRSLTAHVDALQKLGVILTGVSDGVRVLSPQKNAADIVMYEASDTATENALIAAARIPGVTTIRFAASNYMVQDVCVFLEGLGVRIEGIGTSTLLVHGVGDIDKEAEGEPSEDPIETMFFVALAATTHSSLTIERCPIDFLELELMRLEKMGLRIVRGDPTIGNNGRTRLTTLTVEPSELSAADEKIAAMPYPGINIDNLPFFVPIATQASGRTLIHDWVYENRALYYTEFNKLGADVVLADPHRVLVTGSTPLKPAAINAPPALRPATSLLIGMLAAPGESVLSNVYPINRGYERLHERLQELGADIRVAE